MLDAKVYLEQYSTKNCLLWGTFTSHCKEANLARKNHSWSLMIEHAALAALQFLSVFGQIFSLIERHDFKAYKNRKDLQLIEDLATINSPLKISQISQPVLNQDQDIQPKSEKVSEVLPPINDYDPIECTGYTSDSED